ncbi:hypothetical protein ElyMa_003768800 [Elysia marginata]|uniref:Uncharacterized protein n=1 Tax=Elysia marginata TaxID=1093978 RepID=A0AAV4FAY7_9GAST|nr:hypothetical protein ElyMa_003768800 [Elysia marginata]
MNKNNGSDLNPPVCADLCIKSGLRVLHLICVIVFPYRTTQRDAKCAERKAKGGRDWCIPICAEDIGQNQCHTLRIARILLHRTVSCFSSSRSINGEKYDNGEDVIADKSPTGILLR